MNGASEADMFVLGDSDDEDEDGLVGSTMDETSQLPPPYREIQSEHSPIREVQPSPTLETPSSEAPSSSDPSKYYIQPGDTLASISLKLGIDVSSI